MDALAENPTRKRILLMLKKNGSMSVDSLSKEVSITPMGVRQHLLILERKGIVDSVTKKHGVGRPGFLYKLTDRADDLFPKAYQEFSIDILVDIEGNDGKDKIDGIFKRRKERIVSKLMKLFSGTDNLADRLNAFADVLQNSGCIVELDENSDHFRLKQFNCPISKVALKFKEACYYDLQVFRELIRDDVARQQCLSDGDNACVYVIPKNI
jgi:predicted ArsR family transcriptional regulator